MLVYIFEAILKSVVRVARNTYGFEAGTFDLSNFYANLVCECQKALFEAQNANFGFCYFYL
jgi:hypothetical protein